MKKVIKSSKKGFTLVELIVVLVILAILAAMLVPALTGYIKRARQEKDYQMAATVLTAVQSAATWQYSKGKPSTGTLTITGTTSAGNGTNVMSLIGDASELVSDISFTADTNGLITGGSVKINKYTYSWNPKTATWTATGA
ncbi:MAG: type II secretion system protein [Ruminococcaceae bacterium]|nr:type II secretion system protein [Oscillospiraceae bacterium]